LFLFFPGSSAWFPPDGAHCPPGTRGYGKGYLVPDDGRQGNHESQINQGDTDFFGKGAPAEINGRAEQDDNKRKPLEKVFRTDFGGEKQAKPRQQDHNANVVWLKRHAAQVFLSKTQPIFNQFNFFFIFFFQSSKYFMYGCLSRRIAGRLIPPWRDRLSPH